MCVIVYLRTWIAQVVRPAATGGRGAGGSDGRRPSQKRELEADAGHPDPDETRSHGNLTWELFMLREFDYHSGFLRFDAFFCKFSFE